MGQDFLDRQYNIPETCQFPCRCRSELCQPQYDVGSVASISKIQRDGIVSIMLHISVVDQDCFIVLRSDADCNFSKCLDPN